jgi:hypothetical protein
MNKLWIVIGTGALLVSIYSAGHSAGYARGHAAGVQSGHDSRDLEVTGLKADISTLAQAIKLERETQAKKVSEVQTQAAEDAIKTQQFLAQQVRQRDQVIQQYKDAVPLEIQTHCALSVETVRAINRLINDEPTSNSVSVDADTTPSAITDSTVGDTK